eukprot:m.302002 g.302002  ORF g.302002 m.302002 type:complete len:366 (+) comp20143_c0_seq37:641-1738(+)
MSTPVVSSLTATCNRLHVGSSRQILVYETGKEGSMSKDHGIALITVLGGIILVLVGLLYKRGENAHVVPYERAKGASSPVRPYASLQPDGNFDTPRTTRLGPKYARMDNRGATFGGGLRMTRVSSEAILNPSDVSATTSTDSRTLHEHQYIPCRAASAMRDSVLYAAIPSRATSPQVSYRWTPQQEAYCVPCSRRTYEDALNSCSDISSRFDTPELASSRTHMSTPTTLSSPREPEPSAWAPAPVGETQTQTHDAASARSDGAHEQRAGCTEPGKTRRSRVLRNFGPRDVVNEPVVPPRSINRSGDRSIDQGGDANTVPSSVEADYLVPCTATPVDDSAIPPHSHHPVPKPSLPPRSGRRCGKQT